jgi:hypothetical protein
MGFFEKKRTRTLAWWGAGAVVVGTALALWKRHAKRAWDTDLDLHEILAEIAHALSVQRAAELVGPFEQAWRLRDSTAFPALG